MDAHQETTLTNHLYGLDDAQLENVKNHADAADSENHSSFKALTKWLTGVLGVTVTTGIVWKAIKVIQKH